MRVRRNSSGRANFSHASIPIRPRRAFMASRQKAGMSGIAVPSLSGRRVRINRISGCGVGLGHGMSRARANRRRGTRDSSGRIGRAGQG